MNKVSTAVELRLDLNVSGLPEPLQRRLLELSGQRATKRREVVIFAQRFRTQPRNRADAEERLEALLQRAQHRAKPRVATRPSAGARKRRTDDKKRRGAIKKNRKPAGHDD